MKVGATWKLPHYHVLVNETGRGASIAWIMDAEAL